MTRTREDGKEEVFSACIKHDNTRYLGGNKSSSIVATKLQGRPRAGTNKKADYNWIRGNNGQDTDKAVRVLRLGGSDNGDSPAGSGRFSSHWVRSDSSANVGFFTTVKLD